MHYLCAMNKTNILLTLIDRNGGKKSTRDIDISNIYYQSGDGQYIASTEGKQRELLENWIEERGNEQHSTATHKADLELDSWILY